MAEWRIPAGNQHALEEEKILDSEGTREAE